MMADMKNGLFPPAAAAAAADDIPSKLISELDSRSVEGRYQRNLRLVGRSVGRSVAPERPFLIVRERIWIRSELRGSISSGRPLILIVLTRHSRHTPVLLRLSIHKERMVCVRYVDGGPSRSVSRTKTPEETNHFLVAPFLPRHRSTATRDTADTMNFSLLCSQVI